MICFCDKLQATESQRLEQKAKGKEAARLYRKQYYRIWKAGFTQLAATRGAQGERQISNAAVPAPEQRQDPGKADKSHGREETAAWREKKRVYQRKYRAEHAEEVKKKKDCKANREEQGRCDERYK